jgi:hypothetical protein
MIKKYRYIETVHGNLHEYVLAFFHKIQTDTNAFNDELFEAEFRPIVKRHPKILEKRLKIIYEYISGLAPTDRQAFCQRVIDSNQIKQICNGEYKPIKFDNKATGIDKILKNLFRDLYQQVLDGDPFRELNNTTLREHFNQFCDANADITLCPICGIGELKKSQDITRDQYDHYLPKALYPFSSINFSNLVPCCKECNSFDAKGEKDTIEVSTGKFFFPYDDNHKGISLVVSVREDNSEIEKIDLELSFSNPDNKNDEIDSWKTIYAIENRYRGYIGARIGKWYKYYFEYIGSPKLSHLDISSRKQSCMLSLEINESLGLEFIRKPVIDALLSGSNIVQAQIQALEYV